MSNAYQDMLKNVKYSRWEVTTAHYKLNCRNVIQPINSQRQTINHDQTSMLTLY